MNQKEFLEIIRGCRRRLNLAGFFQKLVWGLGVGAAVGILFQGISLVVPLYYANVYTVLALVLAVAASGVAAYIRQSSMARTALVMDGFGFRERIITAYENLKSEGAMFELQRADAMKQLTAHRDKIKIPLLPSPKSMLITAGLLLVMLGLVWVPSPVRDYAKELHAIRQEAKEKEKEIEEVLEGLEELANQELTPEELAALQEMMESLKSSMAEFQQASDGESLTTAGQKLNYKYEDMSKQLGNLAQSLQNGATASYVTAEAMQAMADRLQQMSGSTGSQMASNHNGQGNGQNGQSGGQSGNGHNGQGNGQNGQSGGQNGNGQNGGDGQGSGSDGTGSGNNGSGEGTGNGRGTGSANNARDYVSVPNAIADSGNLTGNAANHDNSEYFRAPNGLNWEGTHTSYQAVIGSYEKNAYEGIAKGQYPSGMEDVIKDYFASFN